MNIAKMTATTDITVEDLLKKHNNKQMLRFITCGSVDDGKSTLIGRLLLEAGAVYEDQLAVLKDDSIRHGTNQGEIDPALLLDGLQDERQQGITIDVAYRYFTTANRKFIIADTPGHEQFTRNMATGASNADLAVILVDASKGILQQTKRHAFIASLLGIKHVILAVNKMDLMGYDQKIFEETVDQFQLFCEKLDIPDVRAVPLSALKGDNIAIPSPHTPWYTGQSLLELLETIYVGADRNLKDLRFPVQWVNRPDGEFRGFSGTIASGAIRTGDRIVVLPSGKESKVSLIFTVEGSVNEAKCGQSVTITLEDEINVTRGDILARPSNLPTVSSRADAMLVWMAEEKLAAGRSYWLKQLGQKISCEINSLRYQVDVNSLHRRQSKSLMMNEIGRCEIETYSPIVFDPYSRNRSTGSFILVDRVSNDTVAAGMFVDSANSLDQQDHWQQVKRLKPDASFQSDVFIEDRIRVYEHRPFTVLISGLSGSGKTSVAKELERMLFEDGCKTVLLDGQAMRFGLCRDLGFSPNERSENLRRAAEVAKIQNDAGLICVAAFMAPHADVRDKVKHLIGQDRFFHVHLNTPVDICRSRDTSGIYDAAEAGVIPELPGVGTPYESPNDANCNFSTEKMTSSEIAKRVVNELLCTLLV